MKIAVIGAGIFGCTAAIHCARTGHEVDLFDYGPLLGGATSHNQFRLHAGYHYPRSETTQKECIAGLTSFRKEYGPAMTKQGKQLYAVSQRDSKITFNEYDKALRRNWLGEEYYPYQMERPSWLRMVESWIHESGEHLLDIDILRLIIKRRLMRYGMAMLREPLSPAKYRVDYDKIIVATYARTNAVLEGLGCETRDYQFEIVEKPVIRLPKEFERTGLVVLDGPFFSVDPYMETGFHLFGHVQHAIWASNVGKLPDIPTNLAMHINAGVKHHIPPEQSRFELMRNAAAEFMPAMKQAEHIGSMFTVRAVLPDVEDTDERPTLVTKHDEQVMSVFGGKLPTTVEAAKQVVGLIGQAERIAA